MGGGLGQRRPVLTVDVSFFLHGIYLAFTIYLVPEGWRE